MGRRRTQADVLHYSGAIAKPANIPDTEDLISENGDAAEQVLDRLLRPEADGETPDSETGEGCAHVEAQIAQYSKNAEDEDKGFQDTLAHQHQ